MKQTSSGPGMMMYLDGNTNKEKFVNDNGSANQVISIPANTKVTFTGTEGFFWEQNLRYMGFYPVVAPLPDNKNDIRIFVQDAGFIFIRFVVKKYEFNWTFTNKDTGEVIKTFTNVNEGEFSVTKAVPNCKVTCKVFAYIDRWEEWETSFDYNGKHYTLGSNSKIDLLNWAVPVASTHFTMTSQNPNINNLIGYNGQAYNFGRGNGMFIGKTGLQAKFGD